MPQTPHHRQTGPAKGRGAAVSPPNRFERTHVAVDWDLLADAVAADPDFVPPSPKTEFLHDDTQSIISRNDSPDLGFDASLNPYRGCEHGCAYCYARPYHEFLGFNCGLDFETKIMVKPQAPELLERELRAPSWKPQVLACSGVTDAYQPAERALEITRRCLAVLARFRNPVGIVTKNALVARDIDLLKELAAHQAAAVSLSITTLDAGLARLLEPRASSPNARLRAIRMLAEAGIPVGVSAAPIIPGLNDHEIPQILKAAALHGARHAFYTVVRLPYAVKEVFAGWLGEHFPDRKDKVLRRIEDLRGGRLNSAKFGSRMTGEGPAAAEIKRLFSVAARHAGLNRETPRLSTAAFRVPGRGEQLSFGF